MLVLSCVDGAVSYLIVLNKLLQMPELGTETSLGPQLIDSIMTQMKQWRSDSDDVFLLDADIAADASCQVVTFNVELATFMSEVVTKSSSELSSDEWDFILCSLVSWLQTVHSASLSLVRTPSVMALTTAVSRLLHRSAVCIHSVVPQQLEVYPSSLISEWNDVFSMSAFNMALPLYVSLASDATCQMVSAQLLYFIIISFLHHTHSFLQLFIFCYLFMSAFCYLFMSYVMWL